MVFTDVITSILSGGATGLIGAVISRFADFKNKKLDIEIEMLKNKHEVELRNLDAEILQSEWNARKEISLTESETRIDTADSATFMTALNVEPKLYSNTSKLTRNQNTFMVVVDGVRGLIRPFLTLCFFALSAVIYYQASKLIQDKPMTVENAVDIYTQITATIMYLTTTCVLFWFGVRQKDTGPGRRF